MDVLLAVLAVAVGALIGLVAYDLRARAVILARIITAETKLETASRAMSDAHNSMALRVMELGDKVQAHELKMSGIGGQQSPLHPFPGRRP